MMIEMDELTYLARVTTSGVVGFYTLAIVLVFVTYILDVWRGMDQWWLDPPVQAAAAVAVFMSGVSLGALLRWIEGVWQLRGSSLDFSWVPYSVSGMLVILGAALILLGFSPITEVQRLEMRWWIVLIASLIALGLPLALTMWAAN